MSRKKSQFQLDENAAWFAKRDRERREAQRKAEEQRKPVPGFRSVQLEESF